MSLITINVKIIFCVPDTIYRPKLFTITRNTKQLQTHFPICSSPWSHARICISTQTCTYSYLELHRCSSRLCHSSLAQFSPSLWLVGSVKWQCNHSQLPPSTREQISTHKLSHVRQSSAVLLYIFGPMLYRLTVNLCCAKKNGWCLTDAKHAAKGIVWISCFSSAIAFLKMFISLSQHLPAYTTGETWNSL